MKCTDIPLWPGTCPDVDSPLLIKYQVMGGIEGVVQFYRQELPKHGWAILDSSLIETGCAVLACANAARSATIIIDADRTPRTRVVIRLAGWPICLNGQGVAPVEL